MTTPMKSDFSKLLAVVESDVSVGNYQLTFHSCKSIFKPNIDSDLDLDSSAIKVKKTLVMR
jgi:hypothetical protein